MNIAQLLHQSARRLPGPPGACGRRQGVLLATESFPLRVSRLAAGLVAKFNLQPGDRVAFAMKNCPQYWELLFACWHAGLAAVPMNAKLHAKEFDYIVGNCGAKASFFDPREFAQLDGDAGSRPPRRGPDDSPGCSTPAAPPACPRARC